METEYTGDIVFPQNAGAADGICAAGGFLCRLENEEDIPGQFFQVCTGIVGQSQRYGGVAVMTAGVHHTGMYGSIGEGRDFCDGQGIHIGPEGHGFALSGIEESAHGSLGGFRYPAGETGKGAFYIGHGFGQTAVQFGDAVQSTAEVHNRHGGGSFRKNV
jgi:hypothetical protein